MVEFLLLEKDVYFHDYIADFIPIFILSILLELIIHYIFKKKKIIKSKKHHDEYYSIQDSIGSMGTGISTIILKRVVPFSLMSSIEFIATVWVYKNYRFITVSENSKLSWIICFLSIDFIYYWFHRLSHEINFLWSNHITHHSSEKYNLTTALRQSIFQMYFAWIFYLPIGLFVPPGIYVFHKQFNTINQFWIHTQLIDKLPQPIEFIFNTPSHHRVHHGRNPKYLDKNYGGTLIIWDRIFKTFQIEDEKVYYGLVKQFDSIDPTWSQIHNWFDIYEKFKNCNNFKDKLKSIFYGPAWNSSKDDDDGGRLGNISNLPIPNEINQNERNLKFNQISFQLNCYLFLHFWMSSLFALVLRSVYEDDVGSSYVTLSFIFVYLSLTSFSSISSKKWYSIILEQFRCWLFIIFTLYIEKGNKESIIILSIFRLIYFISSIYLLKYLKINK